MKNFIYNTPTKVEFGQDVELLVGEYVKSYGGKKVLLHFGGESARRSGLLARVQKSLKDAGLDYVELGGVVSNPHVALVRKGIELCRKENVDFVLAVGGGSVIDSAKAIAFGVPAKCDVWEFYEHTQEPKTALPVGAVLTIAAAGSEMSDSSVITNIELTKKRSCKGPLARCKFALMNPALTITLPPYQTAAGCADVLMHTLERYLDASATMEITDSIAEALMRTVMENARILTREPENYNARAEIMWAGSLSHNGLTGCGGNGGDWACHQLGHELNVMNENVAHGATLTAVWGSWARYVYKEAPEKFERLGVNVLGLVVEGGVEEAALAAIEELEEFFWAIEMPTNISELGLNLEENDVEELAVRCSFGETRTIGAIKALNSKDIKEIYNMAR